MATGDFVIRNIRAVRWSGANGALVAQLCNEIEVDDAIWSVVSQTTDQLVLSQQQAGGANPGIWVVYAARPWVLVSNDFAGIWAMLSDATYATRYTTATSIVQAAVDSSTLVAPTYVLQTTSGEAALPALTLLNPNVTVVVTLKTAMPGTSYNVTWRAISGVTLLGSVGLQAGKTVTTTTTQVTIPLRTVGLATVAGVVTVEAATLVRV